MSAVPELIYFNSRGLSEIIRLVLTAAGIKFKETDLESGDEFQALCPELLFKQVPLLRIDGVNIVQSNAIVRYLARKNHLLGHSDLEITRIDELYEGTRDWMRSINVFGFTPDDSKVLEEAAKEHNKYLPIFDKVLTDNGTGYLVGSSLTVADLGLFEVLEATIDYFGKEKIEGFSGVKKFYATLTSLESVQTYLRDIRKPKNDHTYIKKVLNILGR